MIDHHDDNLRVEDLLSTVPIELKHLTAAVLHVTPCFISLPRLDRRNCRHQIDQSISTAVLRRSYTVDLSEIKRTSTDVAALMIAVEAAHN